MKAMRLESIGNLAVREIEKPVPGPDDLLVRVEACGICGTDRHLLHGEFPSTPPVTLGHEFCGIVEAMGEDVKGFRLGARITGDPNISCGRCPQCQAGRVNLCRNLKAIGIGRDGGFADYVIVPQKQAFEIPLDLPATHGAFCEPLACCLHGVDMARDQGRFFRRGAWRRRHRAFDGAARTARRRNDRHSLHPAGSETEAGRRARCDGKRRSLLRRHRRRRLPAAGGLVPGGVDVVIECAGVAETVEQSTRLAKAGGTVVILGVMAQGDQVRIEPFDILFRELRVLGSFINPFTHRRAADLVASGVINVEKLISRKITLEEAPDVIRNPPAAGEVKVLVMTSRV